MRMRTKVLAKKGPDAKIFLGTETEQEEWNKFHTVKMKNGTWEAIKTCPLKCDPNHPCKPCNGWQAIHRTHRNIIISDAEWVSGNDPLFDAL